VNELPHFMHQKLGQNIHYYLTYELE